MAENNTKRGPGHGPGGPRGGFRKPKDLRGTLSKLMGYLGRYKPLLMIVVVLLFISSACSVAGSYLIKPLINDYILPGDFSGLAKMLAVMGGVYAVGALCSYGYARIMVHVAQNTVAKLRADLFNKMQKLPLKFFDTHTHGELMSRYTNDIETVSEALNNSFASLISCSLTFVGTVMMMIVLSPILTAITAVMLGVMLLVVKTIGGRSRRYFAAQQKAIGAVNTVVNKNGLLYGYNTDHLGFAHLCDAHGVDFAGRTVLILGTGGTHNTTSAVARDKGAARVLTVSRTPDAAKGQLSYEEAVASGAQIVINTTPAGMYPNVGVCSLDVAKMPGLEAVLDVVYNPDKTELILRAEEAGVPVAVGGLEMLVAQAVYAAEYFLSRKFDDAAGEIGRITAALRRDMLNVALIGMPSSGKSTVGRALAEKLGKKFIDLDEEIVKADGRSIPDIFAAEGEDGFRAKESAQTARFAKEGRQLLSCGGGIIKRGENLRALHQNGVVLFLDRPLDALMVGGGRPLSSSTEALKKMEAERRPLYLAAADAVIPNSGTVEDAVTAAMEALDEIFSH